MIAEEYRPLTGRRNSGSLDKNITEGFAVRLGKREDALPVQIALARDVYRGHLVCFAAIAAFILLQLRFGV